MMKIESIKKINNSLDTDKVIIEIQVSNNKRDIYEFIEYLNNYEFKHNKVVVIDKDYNLTEIKYIDIIAFYSDKKSNYCRTKNGTYKIKSKLYELEGMDSNFIRISKSCIVNIKHIDKFDISQVGRIVVKLDDLTEEIVSRRKTRQIMKILEERMI